MKSVGGSLSLRTNRINRGHLLAYIGPILHVRLLARRPFADFADPPLDDSRRIARLDLVIHPYWRRRRPRTTFPAPRAAEPAQIRTLIPYPQTCFWSARSVVRA